MKKNTIGYHVISLFILLGDIYIMGEVDLFKPFYIAVVFVLLNMLWFSKYLKMIMVK